MKVVNKNPAPRMDLNSVINHYVYNDQTEISCQTEILCNFSIIHGEIIKI